MTQHGHDGAGGLDPRARRGGWVRCSPASGSSSCSTRCSSGWAHRDELRGVLGMAATLAFARVYMALWVRARPTASGSSTPRR